MSNEHELRQLRDENAQLRKLVRSLEANGGTAVSSTTSKVHDDETERLLHRAIERAESAARDAKSALNEFEAFRHNIDEHLATLTLDRGGAVLDANDKFLSAAGLQRGQAKVGSDFSFLQADGASAAWPTIWDVIEGGASWVGVLRIDNKSNDPITVQVIVTPSHLNDQLVAHAFFIIDSQVRANDSSYSNKFDGSSTAALCKLTRVGTWRFEKTTGRFSCGAELREFFGIPADHELTFEGWLSRFDEIERENLRQCIVAGQQFEIELDATKFHGDYIRVRCAGMTASEGEGGSHLIGICQNASEGQAAKARLSQAFKAAKIGIWEWDIVENKLYNSDMIAEMLGYTLGDYKIRFETWQALCHPDDYPRARADLQNHIDGKTPLYQNDHRLKTKDGKWMWIRDIGEVVDRNPDGTARKIVGVHINIQELKEISDRLEVAHRAANAGLWDWNVVDGTFISNENFHTMAGEKPVNGRIPLEYFRSRLHPDDLADHLAETRRAHFDDAHRYDTEFRYRRNDGSYMWIRSIGKVVERTPEGHPHRMIGVHIDIDAGKQLDAALKAAFNLPICESGEQALSNLARAIADVLDVPIAFVARDFQRDGVAFARILGAHSESLDLIGFEYPLKGSPCEDVIVSEFCIHRDRVSQKYPNDIELRQISAEGYAGLRLYDRNGDPIGVLAIVDREPLSESTDFESLLRVFGTRAAGELERLSIDERLRQAKLDAEKANRAKSDFLANMSHEIRTPLTAILGFADVLTEAESVVDAKNAAATIVRNGKHLLSLINDILDISKVEAGKLELELKSIDPIRLIAEVKSLMQVKAKSSNLDLNVTFSSPVPKAIQSDATRLKQALLNVLGNAIKFTESGSVTLNVNLHDHTDEALLEFDVIDTGIGLTESQVRQLFRPFTQADNSTTRKFGGTGLGLVISRRLAQAMGGDLIVVRSAPGEGTQFRLTIDPGNLDGIPMVTTPSEVVATTQQAEHQKEKKKIDLEGMRVLLVEDGLDNQRLIAFLLRQAGAEVEIAENGKLGLECGLRAKENDQPFDAILMDMQMPIMDGYTATSELRSAGYTGKIIALTAHAMTGDSNRCLEAGCDAYATKPIEKQKLLELIKLPIGT